MTCPNCLRDTEDGWCTGGVCWRCWELEPTEDWRKVHDWHNAGGDLHLTYVRQHDLWETVDPLGIRVAVLGTTLRALYALPVPISWDQREVETKWALAYFHHEIFLRSLQPA